MEESYYWIWLQQVLGIGTVRSEQFLSMDISPKRLYNMTDSEIADLRFFTEGEIRKIRSADMNKAKKAFEFAKRYNIRILTPDRKDYPVRLRNIYSPPLTLYVMGKLPDVDKELAIAMVGSRECTEYGETAARLITEELAEEKAVIVSGLAVGIDSICHKAAIDNGTKTIAVIGSGMDNSYPYQNKELRKRIIRGNGAVVTEYPPGTEPRAFNFHMRNRIISALSSGICVVEAAEKSGALITAAHALSQDRDVFAVPGSIFSPASAGTNKLIKQGAKPVTCGSDILEEYMESRSYVLAERKKPEPENDNSQTDTKIKSHGGKLIAARKAPSYLSHEQKAVYDCLADGERSREEISILTDLPIEKVLVALTQLEIFGQVRCVYGNKYAL